MEYAIDPILAEQHSKRSTDTFVTMVKDLLIFENLMHVHIDDVLVVIDASLDVILCAMDEMVNAREDRKAVDDLTIKLIKHEPDMICDRLTDSFKSRIGDKDIAKLIRIAMAATHSTTLDSMDFVLDNATPISN